ncbi:MAG: hypothetical protein CK431_21325 [Mycobacterium sp.]|nr:MAG: hypothetical protein CK431_21325 [Mycobacterium sp.]
MTDTNICADDNELSEPWDTCLVCGHGSEAHQGSGCEATYENGVCGCMNERFGESDHAVFKNRFDRLLDDYRHLSATVTDAVREIREATSTALGKFELGVATDKPLCLIQLNDEFTRALRSCAALQEAQGNPLHEDPDKYSDGSAVRVNVERWGDVEATVAPPPHRLPPHLRRKP